MIPALTSPPFRGLLRDQRGVPLGVGLSLDLVPGSRQSAPLHGRADPEAAVVRAMIRAVEDEGCVFSSAS